MPSNKLKKFCNVTKFLAQTDKDLYQAVDDLCLFRLFQTRGRGVTFMYPIDKAYRKKIIEHTYSNNPEKAVDMIRSLVLLDFLPKTIDFNNKKDDIPNALHKKLEVVSADDKEVKLKSGHKLVIDNNFKTLRDGDPVAVYKLSGKGVLPTTGTASTMKYNNIKNSRTRDGGGYMSGGGRPVEYKLAKCVEELYGNGDRDIYKTVLSIIYIYVSTDKSDGIEKTREFVYNNVCASARASFYSIITPWFKDHNPIITNMLNDMNIVGLVDVGNTDINKLILKYGSSAKYNDSLRGLITACGKQEDRENTKPRDVVRTRLLSTIRTSTSARMDVLKEYHGNKKKLYNDLLTVYCYLATLSEDDNGTANDYFNGAFIQCMRRVYTNIDIFIDNRNEITYNLSIYYNLVKSDAFLYIPVTNYDSIDDAYKNLRGELPIPTDQTAFTIQFNDIIIKRGGGDSDTFFGGIVNSL
jgi:hypothetical protein